MDGQWIDYVRRTATAVKTASPKTKVGVGFLIPEFAPLRASDDRRASSRLLANEHLARSCAQGSRRPTGQFDQFQTPSTFSYSLAV
jgi:hypothetical protein